MSDIRFSICIPNYNYAHYLDKTFETIFALTEAQFEVVMADNCSTDRSVEYVLGLNDPRVRVRVNGCNVGFARNLDQAGRLATGTHMIMLSSDDEIRDDALKTYREILEQVSDPEQVIICSKMNQIDPESHVTGTVEPSYQPYAAHYRDEALSEVVGCDVYRAPASDILAHSLRHMNNPMPFASTCYPRSLYESLEGYGGGRMINPDKWFHWRLLSVAKDVVYVDAPLFNYRWHPTNQTAQQAASGALKFMTDEYASTLEVSGDMLACASVSREELKEAFIEYDVGRHGLATLAKGNAVKAKRICYFGKAVYPDAFNRNKKCQSLVALLAMGPVGRMAAKGAYQVREKFLPSEG